MNQKILLGGLSIIIIVIVALIFVVDGGNFLDRFSTPTPTPAPVAESVVPPSPTPIEGESILFTGLRFTPQTLELRVGFVTNIANFGDNPIEIATNDTSEEGRKMNLGVVEPGDTSQFVEFRAAGVYEYFNKLNPEESGRIIVRD